MSFARNVSSNQHREDANDGDVEIRSAPVKLYHHQYACDANRDWSSESSPITTTTSSEQSGGVVIKDVVPRSMYYNDREDHHNDDDDCLCSCACCRCECCPTVSDWCIRDPYGLSCGFMTWFLFIYGQFVMIFVILIPKSHSNFFNLINLLIFHTLELLAVTSHYKTMFSNPVSWLS